MSYSNIPILPEAFLSPKNHLARGGGSDSRCTSMLEHISVWNGGSKIKKPGGTGYTQNGGKIDQSPHRMGVIIPVYTHNGYVIKTRQILCEMGCFVKQVNVL